MPENLGSYATQAAGHRRQLTTYTFTRLDLHKASSAAHGRTVPLPPTPRRAHTSARRDDVLCPTLQFLGTRTYKTHRTRPLNGLNLSQLKEVGSRFDLERHRCTRRSTAICNSQMPVLEEPTSRWRGLWLVEELSLVFVERPDVQVGAGRRRRRMCWRSGS